MKNPAGGILLSLFVCAASTTTLRAISPSGYSFTFDANGNGTTEYFLGSLVETSSLPHSVESDPSGGIIGAPVLVYSLPVEVNTGDVAIVSSDMSSVPDLLRFYTPVGADTSILILYSDQPGVLADSGLPPIADGTDASFEMGERALWGGAGIGGVMGAAPVGYGYRYVFLAPEPSASRFLIFAVAVILLRKARTYAAPSILR